MENNNKRLTPKSLEFNPEQAVGDSDPQVLNFVVPGKEAERVMAIQAMRGSELGTGRLEA